MVVTGWCTRLVPWFSGLDKRYCATLRFGEETDTLDPEGEVIGRGEIPTAEAVENILERFRGPIEQIPPEYSAVHTSGERAYKLARAGKKVELTARSVEVFGLEIDRFEPPEADISVHCSKGTYIRSLARDIGRASGSRAYLSSLRRTDIGPFSVSAARTPEDIDFGRDTIDAAAALSSIGGFYTLKVEDEIKMRIQNGVKMNPVDLGIENNPDGESIIISETGELIAVIEKNGNRCGYRMVVPLRTI